MRRLNACGRVLREVLPVMVMTVLGWTLRAQEPGFHLEGMISRDLPVSGRKMTNVIFPADIAAGVRVSRDVLVKKVKGVENVIELKALKRDFASTNLAVYGKDGRLYSFVLHYVEDTTVLDYRVVSDEGPALSPVRLTGWPMDPAHLWEDGHMLARRWGFLHRTAASDGLRVTLKGIYLLDSLCWLTVELRDRTVLGCGACSIRIYTEDRKKIKRTATQEVEITPVYTEGMGKVSGKGCQIMAVAIRPMVVGSGKCLVIEIRDEEEDRRVLLKVKGKVLRRIRKG